MLIKLHFCLVLVNTLTCVNSLLLTEGIVDIFFFIQLLSLLFIGFLETITSVVSRFLMSIQISNVPHLFSDIIWIYSEHEVPTFPFCAFILMPEARRTGVIFGITSIIVVVQSRFLDLVHMLAFEVSKLLEPVVSRNRFIEPVLSQVWLIAV